MTLGLTYSVSISERLKRLGYNWRKGHRGESAFKGVPTIRYFANKCIGICRIGALTLAPYGLRGDL